MALTTDTYYLLDSRAGLIAVENDGILKTEDNGKYLLFEGTLKECCKFANNGSMGEHNVVSDQNYKILWHLVNRQGHWIYKNL